MSAVPEVLVGSRRALALRYATRSDNTASDTFHRWHLYGESDREMPMDYYIWLIDSGDGLVVVDTGFNEVRGGLRNRSFTTHPAVLLERVGVDPKDVTTVVLSHMHFDHSGNTDLFPNARFVIARAEFEYWTGELSRHPAIAWPGEPHEIEQLRQFRNNGRLQLVEDEVQIATGVRVIRLPGHTPGQLITEVTFGDERVILTSDAMHYHEEVEMDRPFYLYTSITEMLDSYRYLRALKSESGVTLVPGHDPRVASDFVAVADECFDLRRPRSKL